MRRKKKNLLLHTLNLQKKYCERVNFMVLHQIKFRIKFLFGLIKDRTTKVTPEEIEAVNKILNDSMAFLQSTLGFRLNTPELTLERKNFSHYGELIDDATETGGHFNSTKPNGVYVVRGSDYTRGIPHELMHYSIYNMNLNPQHRYFQDVLRNQNISINMVIQWRLAMISALEECSCYLFDALYYEKVTGKKYVLQANENFANQDKFAEKFYQSLKAGLPEWTLSAFVMRLERKYKQNDIKVAITMYLRMINAINLLLLDHHKGDIKAAFIDTIDMQKNGIEYISAKLQMYTPEKYANAKMSSMWSLDDL